MLHECVAAALYGPSEGAANPKAFEELWEGRVNQQLFVKEMAGSTRTGGGNWHISGEQFCNILPGLCEFHDPCAYLVT
jgi:hypothetical protein